MGGLVISRPQQKGRGSRRALQDAASVAGLLVTTEAMVAEVPKEQPAMPAMPPGGGMGGMGF